MPRLSKEGSLLGLFCLVYGDSTLFQNSRPPQHTWLISKLSYLKKQNKTWKCDDSNFNLYMHWQNNFLWVCWFWAKNIYIIYFHPNHWRNSITELTLIYTHCQHSRRSLYISQKACTIIPIALKYCLLRLMVSTNNLYKNNKKIPTFPLLHHSMVFFWNW